MLFFCYQITVEILIINIKNVEFSDVCLYFFILIT